MLLLLLLLSVSLRQQQSALFHHLANQPAALHYGFHRSDRLAGERRGWWLCRNSAKCGKVEWQQRRRRQFIVPFREMRLATLRRRPANKRKFRNTLRDLRYH
uniref:Putative secreted protein n=1 Tax=Anopheles darlingi TaxID=43151 RepID=A0A2M4DGZ1_ANODA